jgi:CRP/FNR family cyclic AMP-dependent transcriptional regulator
LADKSLFTPKSILKYIETNGERVTYRRGEFIYHLGDLTSHVFLLKSGHIFVSRMQEDGKELVTNFIDENGIFGAITLFCGAKEHSTYAKAKTDIVLSRVERQAFEQEVLSNQVLTKEWMTWLDIDRNRHATKMRDLMLYGKNGALYSVLIRLSNSFGKTVEDGILIDTTLTNQDLAQLCGTSREVVNRALAKLKKDGIISIDQKLITIHHLDILKHGINCDSCEIDICQVF